MSSLANAMDPYPGATSDRNVEKLAPCPKRERIQPIGVLPKNSVSTIEAKLAEAQEQIAIYVEANGELMQVNDALESAHAELCGEFESFRVKKERKEQAMREEMEEYAEDLHILKRKNESQAEHIEQLEEEIRNQWEKEHKYVESLEEDLDGIRVHIYNLSAQNVKAGFDFRRAATKYITLTMVTEALDRLLIKQSGFLREALYILSDITLQTNDQVTATATIREGFDNIAEEREEALDRLVPFPNLEGFVTHHTNDAREELRRWKDADTDPMKQLFDDDDCFAPNFLQDLDIQIQRLKDADPLSESMREQREEPSGSDKQGVICEKGSNSKDGGAEVLHVQVQPAIDEGETPLRSETTRSEGTLNSEIVPLFPIQPTENYVATISPSLPEHSSSGTSPSARKLLDTTLTRVENRYLKNVILSDRVQFHELGLSVQNNGLRKSNWQELPIKWQTVSRPHHSQDEADHEIDHKNQGELSAYLTSDGQRIRPIFKGGRPKASRHIIG